MVKLAQRVLKNSIYNSLGVLVTTLGGLIYTVILARLLLPELFGLYHLALSVGLLLLTFTNLGVHDTLIRYVSHAIGEEDHTLARSYVRYLFKIKIILSLSTSAILIFSADLLALQIFHKPEISPLLAIVGLYIFFQSLLEFVSSLFISLQKFELLTIRYVVYESARLILVPCFIIMGYGVGGALLGLVISVIFSLIVPNYFIFSSYKLIFKGPVCPIERRKILRFLGYLTFGSVSGAMFTYVDSIMLGIFMAAEYVGYYRAAFNIVIAFMGLVSISSVLFPVFTQMDKSELDNAFNRVFKYSSVISFPSAFGLIFLSDIIIRAVYGVDYLPAVIPMQVIALLVIIYPFSLFGVLFNAREMPEIPAKLTAIFSILNIVMNYFFILEWGIMGAAVATVFCRYLNVISFGILSRRILGISPSMDFMYKPLLSSIIMLCYLYIIPGPSGVLSTALVILTAAIVYLSSMVVMKGLLREDLIYICEVVGKGALLDKMVKILKLELKGNGKN
jgi:O-antigen/teichoic acid export membrane protein